MPEHRRKFSPQFRAEAVQIVVSTGKPIAEVAPGPGDPWRGPGELGERVAAGASRAGSALSPVERARVKELEDKVARLPMEDEFLKKAAFFARTHP